MAKNKSFSVWDVERVTEKSFLPTHPAEEEKLEMLDGKKEESDRNLEKYFIWYLYSFVKIMWKRKWMYKRKKKNKI